MNLVPDGMSEGRPREIAREAQDMLQAGDAIFTGTPAGVGAAKVGDELVAGINGLGELRVSIVGSRRAT